MIGAVFDMDGVLVDNVDHHVEAWRNFGHEMGKDLTEEEIRETFGQRNQDMLEALLGRSLSNQSTQQHGERKEELYRKLMSPDLQAKIVPGLIDFLSQLKEQDYRMAVATSGPPENANFVLDGLGIRKNFHAVVTGADVVKGKPDPEIFLLAANQLELSPLRCIVFEDSSSGIAAARQAGSPCVALATTHHTEELRKFLPDLIVRDFREVNPDRISELLEAG